MKKKILSMFILSGIIAVYGFLYLACSVDKCDDACYKLENVSMQLLKDSLRIKYAGQWGADNFSIGVNDSIQQSWNGLADTTCQYINNEGLHHYTVAIFSWNNRDTLVKQTCP